MVRRDFANIVILGASYAGIAVAHQFLQSKIDELRITQNAPRYRVVLVAPNTHLFWSSGAALALAPSWNPKVDDLFIPFLESFKSYPDDEFLFIQGEAVRTDFRQRTIALNEQPAGSSSATTTTLNFHALVIATGTSAASDLLSLHGNQDKTRFALQGFRNDIITASSCVIVGGATMGIECAGQIAAWARHARSRQQPQFSSRYCFKTDDAAVEAAGKSVPASVAVTGRHLESGKRTPTTFRHSGSSTLAQPLEVILISGGPRVLHRMQPKVGRQAEKILKQLDVHIINEVRLIAAQALPNGTTQCILSDDSVLSCDLLIAATGATPNTKFLDPTYLCSRSFVVVNQDTFRMPRAGARVFAVGSCTALDNKLLWNVLDSIPVLLHNLTNDLLEFELRTGSSRRNSSQDLVALAKDIKFEPGQPFMQRITISHRHGLAIIRGHKVPGIFYRLLNGRNRDLEQASQLVNDGESSRHWFT